MDTPSVAEFFKRVCAWPGEKPGFVNAHWTSPKHNFGFGGKPTRTLVDFMSLVGWASTHPQYCKDIYFCLSTQRDVGKLYNGRPSALRNKGNATAIKCIVLDVDVKEAPKGYANVGEALQAIKKFVADAHLPLPTALVHSGGGVHVYWISDRGLSLEEWAPYAGGLRALADVHGLRFDAAVTIDCVRVLRIPGTNNCKQPTPRPVKLLTLATTDYNFETALGHIRRVDGGTVGGVPQRTAVDGRMVRLVRDTPAPWNVAALPKQAPPAILSTAEYQAEIGQVFDNTPLDPTPILHECPFFRSTIFNGGVGQEQGLWMQTALAATFLDNGRKIFHALSKGDPRYTEADTDAMFDRKLDEREEIGLRWPSCQTFEQYGSKQCAGCKHKGKIKGPLNLTRSPPPPEKPPEPPDDGLNLPPGFWVDPDTGYITVEEQMKLGNGVTVPKKVSIFLDKITGAWYQDNNDIHFTTTLAATKTAPVIITNEQVATIPVLVGALRRQGVNTNPDGKVHLEKLMASWIEILRKKKARESLAYGWWYEDDIVKGWAYGGVIQTEDGRTLKATPGGTNRELYTPRGKLEPWFAALRLITDQHRPAIEAIVAASFASPLLHWTGHYSGALVAYSQSGGNKSTAVNVGGAVWGHPKKTKSVASASANAMRVKMAVLNNLPAYWDDVSEKSDIEKAGLAIKEFSQGVDGNKLFQDRSERPIGSWQNLLCICSNSSMFDHYKKVNKSHAAGLYRIFEYEVPMKAGDLGRVKDREAEELQQVLETNYGVMGEKYSKLYLSNPKMMKQTVNEIQDQLEKKLCEGHVPDQERFWLAIITTVLAGAHLANALDATFNLHELETFLIEAYRGMRARVADSSVDGSEIDNTDKILGDFLKENSDNVLHTKDRAQRGPNPHVVVLHHPENQGRPIHVQWVVEERLLRFSRGKFDEFLDKNNYQPSMTMSGLKAHYKARWGKDYRVNMSAGTVFHGAQEKVVEIDVPAPIEGQEPHWLWSEMHSHTPGGVMRQMAAPGTEEIGL